MKLDRRSFVKLIPVAAVAAAVVSWWFLTRAARRSNTAFKAMSTASQGTRTTTPETFVFPVTWNGDRPTEVSMDDYRLKVDGDVSRPLELGVQELYAMSGVQKTLKIECVEGWAADVPWEGIPLSHLLSLAGASLENIADITVESITGYRTMISPNMVASSDIMIALKAGGLPLTVEHGYPARLVVPAKFGLDWVKYVERITCTGK